MRSNLAALVAFAMPLAVLATDASAAHNPLHIAPNVNTPPTSHAQPTNLETMSATAAERRIDSDTNSARVAANAPDPEAKCKLISHPNFTNELVMRGAGFYSSPDGHNEGEHFVSNDAFEQELKQALKKCAGMARWSFANLTPAYDSVWEFEIHATFQLMQHECIQDALVSVGAPKKIKCPFKMDLGNGRHWGDQLRMA
ncbi:hypothetical protein LTR97_001795 [Elasticomyces elasticus]|uniref:Uncharacterized protein n=1 Tax=Elasticomyces elasticus TaxID=574655 RepID=A0AAN7WD73_9PEZI|nr:hypothetical protein LTR97_001795 [Elasticomyces elasticus]